MTKIDCKYNATPEYKFFYYDGEGEGFVYFKSIELRDRLAQDAIQMYLDDCWSEEVTQVVCGEMTHQATMVDKRGPIGKLDEDGFDGAGYCFSEHDYYCNYKLKPIGFVCPSTLEKDSE